MSGIGDWLEGLGLGEYVEAFEAEKIRLDHVPELDDSDLEKLGLPMGPRKALLKAARDLRESADAKTEARPTSPADYTPASLAEKILSARSTIEGERKQVTILFADIKGSTEIIQELDPEDARALLDPLLNVMMDAVHTYEGTVNDVMGDGIMAIFGAPIAHEDHALRACRAALDMKEAARRRVEESAPDSPARFARLRVGLNSGEVVVRAINNDLTMSYSAVGVATHLAARMEQLAEPGSIQLTGDTLRLVEGLVDVAPLGEVQVKGLTEPVRVFELSELGKARTRLEAIRIEELTPFVGRARDLAELEERLGEAEAGHGQVVTLVGDAGIGKSRLVMEFRRRIGDRAVWLEGRCISFGQSMAYHPLIDMLRRNFRIDDRDAATTIREKVADGVARVGEDLEPTLGYLHYLLGAASPEDPIHRMDPRLRRGELFEALRQLLLRAADLKPQVLVFEDLHWSDTATKAFLDTLLDSVPRSRVLFLLTLRTGYPAPVGERTYVTRLALQSFSEAESAELAGAVLTSADLPEALRALVLGKAEGNPFFVEEVIKSLRETGTIRREGGQWVLGESLERIVVPDTIHGVLASRIDRLEDEPKRTLQLASVIGREFTQRLLDRIADIRGSTSEALRVLQGIKLIYEKTLHPELAYMFKHALTHEVAYGSLLAEQRRVLHRSVGDAIEELYADRLAKNFAVLGYHFGRAEDWPKAADYFEKAADHAAASFAAHDAIELCDQAIEALVQSGQEGIASKEGALHEKKASLFILVGDFDRAHAENEKAADIAHQLANPLGEGSALAGMAFASLYGHKFERSLSESRRVTEIARAVGSEELIAVGQFTTGFVQTVTGHLLEARTNLGQAHERSRSAGAAFHQSSSAAMLSVLDRWQDNYYASVSMATEAVGIARAHNFSFPLAMALFTLGPPLVSRGNYEAGLAAFSEGLAIAEKLGNDVLRNRFLNSLGWLHAECGDFENAILFNEKGVSASRDQGDPETIANCELNCQRRSKISPPGRSKTSPLNVMRYAVLGGCPGSP